MTGVGLAVNAVKKNKDNTKSTTRSTLEGQGKGKFRGGGQLHNNFGNCGRSQGRRQCPAF